MALACPASEPDFGRQAGGQIVRSARHKVWQTIATDC